MRSQSNTAHVEDGLESSPKTLASWYAQGLSDGLGDRLLMFDNSSAPSLELLRFRRDFAEAPEFEIALRERVRRLDEFRHPAFARVRAVQLLEPDDDLALVSNYAPGKRLSEVLHHARGPELAAALVRQLAPALVVLQQHDAGVSHGILNPDRIVLSPEGRLTIVEHVVGPAIDALNLRSNQLASLGIPLPPGMPGAAPRLDAATDWYQLGVIAVSVLLGRPVSRSELPQLEMLLDRLSHSMSADARGFSPFMRQWLDRALQISGNRIESGADARAALDELIRKEQPSDLRPARSARYGQAALALLPPSGRQLLAELARYLSDARPSAVKPQPASVDAEPKPGPIGLAPVGLAPVAAPISEPRNGAAPTTAPPNPLLRPVRLDRPHVPPVPAFFDEEPFAAQKRHVDPWKGAAVQDPNSATRARPSAPQAATPAPRAVARTGVPIAMAATLALIAGAEAGVIAWMARALAAARSAPAVVGTAPSVESVGGRSGATEAAPLRLATAPDLSWVRVTSSSPAGVPGALVTDSSSGTLRISAPISLKVFEGTRQLGTVPGADLKIPAGRHDLVLVNPAFGYRLTQGLEIEAGQTVSIHVAPPPGWVTVDASPTADVSIDGQSIGRTPLGPLPLALGEYAITFRYPAGAWNRQRVTVKSGQTSRVTGTLRR